MLDGVFADHVGQLLAERSRVRRQPLVVGGPELHDEVVGHEDPTLADDRAVVVGLPLQLGGDLDRLDLSLEHAREGTGHQSFEPTLEALQHSHAASRFSPCRW